MEHNLQNNDDKIVITAESPEIQYNHATSTDCHSTPNREYFFGDDAYRPTSRHRVALKRGDDVLAYCVLQAEGGSTGVHLNSMVLHSDSCFVAVGPFVCALELPSLRLLWRTRVDDATCFGIYNAPKVSSLISHGELAITRLSYSGDLLWSTTGRDIFSGDFRIQEHHIDVVDFAGACYRIELETGESYAST